MKKLNATRKTINTIPARCRSGIFQGSMSYEKKNYRISDDRNEIQLDKVETLLKSSYWASERPLETIKLSIENSICFSLFYKNEQVGFARVVTDFASVANIADLIVQPDHRAKGIGKWMFEVIHSDSRWCSKFQFLATDDAHGHIRSLAFQVVTN